MNRRTFLMGTAATALASRIHANPKPKRILFFTKSSGFEHSVIKMKGDEPGHAFQVLKELGAKHNFEVVHSKDGSLFNKEYCAQFDAFFFATTGNLTTPGTDKNPPMSAEGKQAFLDAIKGGKGYIGTHNAADTCHTQPDPNDRSNRYKLHGEKSDPYILMLGGEFIKHGPQQVARMRVTDPKFPGMSKAGGGFQMMEEWYSLKDFTPDIHVLLVQETAGMKGDEYKRAAFPATWARKYGKGNVFYTSMGHREDVWTNPLFQEILMGGIQFALHEVKPDITPNLESAAPGHKELPPFVPPK